MTERPQPALPDCTQNVPIPASWDQATLFVILLAHKVEKVFTGRSAKRSHSGRGNPGMRCVVTRQ